MKDIIIVGAGPTGLTLALCLAQYNIPFKIIDNRKGPVDTSNALAVQPRTLHIWHSLGVLEQALSLGHPLYRGCIHDKKSLLGTIDLSLLKTTYPFILGLSQHHTEQLLEQALKLKGVTVQRNIECLGINPIENKYLLTLKDNQQSYDCIADYVFACDGSHSVIRNHLSIPFLGETLPQRFIMADVHMTSTLCPNSVHAFLSESGVMAMIPVKEFSRIIIEVTNLEEIAHKHQVSIDDFIPLIAQRSHTHIEIQKALWTSTFGIHQKKITTFKHGNIFFLGDAAHIHSPVGGQGMNLGIQDAFNVGWKLAQVFTKHLPTSALDSFDQERNPIAQQILDTTSRATKMISLHNKFLIGLRNCFINQLLSLESLQRPLAQTLGQLSQTITNHSWFMQKLPGMTPLKKPTAGDLFISGLVSVEGKNMDWLSCLDYRHWTLIYFSQKQSTEQVKPFVARLQTLTKHLPIRCLLVSCLTRTKLDIPMIMDSSGFAHQSYHADRPCLIFIRPDHMIAYRVEPARIEAFEKMLSTTFEKPAPKTS